MEKGNVEEEKDEEEEEEKEEDWRGERGEEEDRWRRMEEGDAPLLSKGLASSSPVNPMSKNSASEANTSFRSRR